MRSHSLLLALATLALAVPQVSSATITCDPTTCTTVPYTLNGPTRSLIPVYIPPGVTSISFYARGGNGAIGGNYQGGGGGGGACAYTSSGSYILCVGGGSGGTPTGAGVGGSTAGNGLGGTVVPGGWNYVAAVQNGAGGSATMFNTVWPIPAYGGAPGNGGSRGPAGGGAGGGGGNVTSASGNGTDWSAYGYYAYGGQYLDGGGGCFYGPGGGGGFGGGAGGGWNTTVTWGGGGSSYYHPNLSGPDANGYRSIPVSALGPVNSTGPLIGYRTIMLTAGGGGIGACYANPWGQPATITASYLCSANYSKPCTTTATNSCGQPGNGAYDCSENCIDFSTGAAVTPPATPSYYNTACTSYPNACGQTGTGTYNCSYTCSAATPALPAGYGSPCISAANSCGQTNSGTIGCNGSCSATTPANPSLYGTFCSLTSAPNACGQTTTVANSGTYNCSGTCSGTTPTTPPVTTPTGKPYLGACSLTSPANSCGQTTTATGTYTCSGVCSVATPPAPSDATCGPSKPVIEGLYQGTTYFGNSASAYDPLGYQVYARATSPDNANLTYYFEWSTDGVNWTGDPGLPAGGWATVP